MLYSLNLKQYGSVLLFLFSLLVPFDRHSLSVIEKATVGIFRDLLHTDQPRPQVE